MKKFYFLFVFTLYTIGIHAQQFVLYSTDSSRIKYATFREFENRDIVSEDFFSIFLQLDPQNKFVPSDTLYSPDSAYTYIKYRQQYSNYEVEGAMVTLTYHNHSIIRFNGYYLPANNLSLQSASSDEDAIAVFQQYYQCYNDSCEYFVSKLVTYNSSAEQAQLCFQIQCTDPALYGKILYVSTDDLSIVKENVQPGAGFNAIFYTQYNGVRSGYNTCLPWTPPEYILKDPYAAVEILDLYPNVTNLKNYFEGVTNTFYNSTDTWGYNTQNIYPNYILDAYWSASEYSYYMQNSYNVPKDIFQRYWRNNQYEIYDTITPIIIANNTYVDNTFWQHVSFIPSVKDYPHETIRNVILIGAPGSTHNPKASIDEVVHEFAHIFSYQYWNYNEQLYPNSYNKALSEACADIWAAIITSHIYPNNENKIWKIGEDVVIPSSGFSCIRNLANPSDITAEIQMNDNACQVLGSSAYEQSGVFSHWFYLLTHGFSGTGCDNNCYNFQAIPIDSAAKLLYYCESSMFMTNMELSDVCQATIDATENFCNAVDMKSSVITAWRVLGVKPYEMGIEQFGLSYNGINESIYYVDKDLVIDSLRTLTVTGTLRMNDTCSIIVRPGGKLIVDGGTLTSACSNEMWQGIEVVGDHTKRQLPQYQGTVELRNGATIENAYCAIRTGLHEDINYATTGGIIKADSTHFVNNRCAVEMNSYTNRLPNGSPTSNVSHFYNCSFEVDNNNLFAANNCSFRDHIVLCEVWIIKIKGCSFSNSTNEQNDRRHAIYILDAGLTLDTYCNSEMSIPEGCECPDINSTYNEFSGFSTAVEVNTAGAPYIVYINHALFSNNVTGIKINNSNYVTVTRCYFDMQSTPISASDCYGIYLNNICSGYTIEENHFYRSSLSHNKYTGVKVQNSGTSANTIYHNIFDKMSNGIYVSGTNSGLQMLCNDFNNGDKDIYIAADGHTSVSPSQGSLQISAGNTFDGTSFFNINNTSIQNISYYYTGKATSINPYYPSQVTSNVSRIVSNTANPCTPTLCNNNNNNPRLAGFSGMMDSYTAALDSIGANDDSPLQGENLPLTEMARNLSEIYYAAVRSILSDTVLDLNALEQWHSAAQPIADPYSLTETRFAMGYSEPFVADADDAELANYAEFHAMKLALRNNDGSVGNINWYALTDAQIAQLQTIAERNTGRASEMAKGVLCFFFGICYDNDLMVDDNADNHDNHSDAEIRSAKAAQQDGETNLNVYPNPADDILYVELSGAGIANATLYDLQGRVVWANHDSPIQGIATLNVRNVPAGVYVLRVTDVNGKEYHRKVVVD